MRSFGCLKGVKIIKCNEITENIVNNEQNYYIVLFYKFVLINYTTVHKYTFCNLYGRFASIEQISNVEAMHRR